MNQSSNSRVKLSHVKPIHWYYQIIPTFIFKQYIEDWRKQNYFQLKNLNWRLTQIQWCLIYIAKLGRCQPYIYKWRNVINLYKILCFNTPKRFANLKKVFHICLQL